MSDFLRPYRLLPTKFLGPRDSPGKSTGVGCHFLLQGIFPTQGLNLCLLHSLPLSHLGIPVVKVKVKLLSRIRLFANPWTVAYQASPSMGFSRQEYWSGLPFPSPYSEVKGWFFSLKSQYRMPTFAISINIKWYFNFFFLPNQRN